MSEQILSQLEVDALLRGLTHGDIKTETEKSAAEQTSDVRPYDFSGKEKTVRGKMPTLEMLCEKFSRSVRTQIFSIVRKTVDISHEWTKAMKYEEFLRNLHMPSSLNVFYMHPLTGQGILALDPNLAFALVDSYFGGDCRYHSRIEGKDFTAVELSVIKKVVDVMLRGLETVWKPVHKVEFEHVRVEMNPQFVNIIGHTESAIVSCFRMEIESTDSKFYVCLPYAMIEPIKDKLYGTQSADVGLDKKWSASLVEQVAGVPMSVSVEVGSASIPVSDLLNLKVGDVVALDHRVKDPLDVKIEGVSKFRVKPGIVENHYSVQIVSSSQERG